MKKTSLDAYAELSASGKKLTQQERVLQVLSECAPLTRNELSERTGLRLSSVCGRVNELVAKGLAGSIGARRCTVTDKTCEVVTNFRTANVDFLDTNRSYEKESVARAGVNYVL